MAVQWQALLKTCGYSEINVLDVTCEWADFTSHRREKYNSDYQDKVILYGEPSAQRLHHFYNVVADCFQKGMLKEQIQMDGLLGIRIIAKKIEISSL